MNDDRAFPLKEIQTSNECGLRCIQFKEQCQWCKFWEPLPDHWGDVAKEGRCRFNAPVAEKQAKTAAKHWCHDFAADLIAIGAAATNVIGNLEYDIKYFLANGGTYLKYNDDGSVVAEELTDEEKERRKQSWIETQEWGNTPGTYWVNISGHLGEGK